MALRLLWTIVLMGVIFSSINIQASTCRVVFGVSNRNSFLYPESHMISYYSVASGKHKWTMIQSIRVLSSKAGFEGKRGRQSEEFSIIKMGGQASYTPSYDFYYFENKTGLYKMNRMTGVWDQQIKYGDPNLRVVNEPLEFEGGGVYKSGKFNLGGKTFEGTLYVRVANSKGVKTTSYYLTGLGLIGYWRSNGDFKMMIPYF